MKTLRNTIALLPLLTLAAACSDSGPDATPAPAEGDFHVMMSVLPSGSQSATAGSDAGSDAERAFDPDHIYFAFYNNDLTYKAFIKNGTQLNNSGDDNIEANYFEPTWGPSVAARVKKSEYENGFVVGFFSVPANTAADNFTVLGMALSSNDANYTLKWPGTIGSDNTGTAWAPEESSGNHIPMAGLVKVTEEEMQNYNPNVYTGVSPFRLPDVRPMRAMAKVVIKDPEGLISKAEMTCPREGFLLPVPAELIGAADNIASVKPRVPATASQTTGKFKQVIEKTATAGNEFVFYSYEQDFTGKTAGTDDRKIITLYSESLGKNGTPAHTTVSIAPYTSEGKIDTSADLSDTKYNGSWQGLMRNRVYTYVINKPSTGGFKITVTAGEWEKQIQDEIL